MWMNEYDIDDAVDQIQHPKHLHRGALFLQAFKDLINSISDGWPYWSYGTKCSKNLQTITSEASWPSHRVEHAAASPEAVHKACQKVRTFLKRCKQTKDKPLVVEFLNGWQRP